MADTTPAAQPDPPKPAKAPGRVRVATGDVLTVFVVPRFEGDVDLVVDSGGVSLPAKEADQVVELAAGYGIPLSVTPEKD